MDALLSLATSWAGGLVLGVLAGVGGALVAWALGCRRCSYPTALRALRREVKGAEDQLREARLG